MGQNKILIRGGLLYDGTGGEPFTADLLVEGKTIARMGPDLPDSGAQVIDARGKVVCPGFIDIHRHCDAAVFTDQDFGQIELAQGISTTVVGNCGMAPLPVDPRWKEEMYRYIRPVLGTVPHGLPLADYAAYTAGLKQLPLPLNMAFLAGAGAIETSLKGFSRAPLSAKELEKAKAFIAQAMDAGALGLSFGIMYQPEYFSSREELESLAREAGKRGGVLCTHIRGEGDSLAASVEEMIQVAGNAEIPLNISHLKATGIQNWGKTIFKAIDCIEQARARGQPVAADFYPYTGGSTTILSLLPPTVQADKPEALRAQLTAPGGRDFLKAELYKNHPGWDNMVTSIGWDRIILSSLSGGNHEQYLGKTMDEAARNEGYEDAADLLADLLLDQETAGIIVLSMDQEDVDTIARLPWTVVISDSLYGGTPHPHPRLTGAFPKLLREYVRERKILSLKEAIHKMTGLAADRVGIKNRGRLAPGNYADIAIFKPECFTDQGDYLNPLRKAAGMDLVMVNGTIAWRQDKTEEYSGSVLSRGV
ncbi:N-acyl-D-aspartate deacylase [Treponema primitia ZAS-2]|uniref:N-acyl-D-aspartate deacylase n=1 Tax=Treponema primitia (strain ATCC BAA-887 / DSM 12427 / ZAS-2) TaxID=545694 RepID=F5YGZ4_TREPZ|nr:D-aminoacylase [Treponema primitia]AEF86852.1 N-acyl-D-aspartate deacylase [Treponema primitia ZAS-2]